MKTETFELNTGPEKEVYLVKIYRRGDKPDKSLVGTVEEITGKKKGAFKTGKGLLSWLKGQRSR